jgi:hypothetical protein
MRSFRKRRFPTVLHLSATADACEENMAAQCRIKILLSSFLLALALPACAAQGPARIACKLYGPPADGPRWQYKTVVEAFWAIDPKAVVRRPLTEAGGCYVVGRRSRLFGAENGTRLQISAWKCDRDEPYYAAKVLLNGLPVDLFLQGSNSRMSFNEGGAGDERPNPDIKIEHQGELPPVKPLSLPEGSFRFLYLDCTVSTTKPM